MAHSLAFFIVFMLFLALVVAPLVNRAVQVAPRPLARPPPGTLALRPVRPLVEAPSRAAPSALEASRIEGRIQQSRLKRMEQIVERHPDEALALIRRWMSGNGFANGHG